MRDEERIEGTAFTRRRKVVRHAETSEEFADALRNWADATRDPWEGKRKQVAQAERWLTAELADKPEGHAFEARVDAGWYLEKIVMHGRLVDHHITKGSSSWAAHEAALLGETWSELQLKLAREELYLAGRKLSECGQASRRGRSRFERFCAVMQLRSAGHTRKAAISIVAEEDGVTFKAVERDYDQHRKIDPKPRD